MRVGGFGVLGYGPWFGGEREANRTCLRVPGGCTAISMDALQKRKSGLTETTAGAPSGKTCT